MNSAAKNSVLGKIYVFLPSNMEFKTTIPMGKSRFRLDHTDSILCLGSCFAESMGHLLEKSGFPCMTNPFGVLYNPLSIVNALEAARQNKSYTSEDLFEYNALYGCFDFHSRFSGRDELAVLQGMNQACSMAHEWYKSATCLIISLGTARVYSLVSSGSPVANCHKLPAAYFSQRRWSVSEILQATQASFQQLFEEKPDLKVFVTISPIRHLKDGAHENTLSKAALHLLVEAWCARFDRMEYFPAYELLLDDLRDYRFYEQDMLHPAPMAVRYIWESFGKFVFDKPTIELIQHLEQVHKAMEHKPFRPEDEQYLRFVKKNIAALHLLGTRFPELDLEREKTFFESVLSSYASNS